MTLKPKSRDNPHKEHRMRMRTRFENSVPDAFQEHEILEMLLYPVIPYKDTNVLAHELINTFGSFPAVFKADIKSLQSVKGMTYIAAVLIKNIDAAYDICNENSLMTRYSLDTKEKVKAFARKKYMNLKKETTLLVMLDEKDFMVDCIPLGEGKTAISSIDISYVVKSANIRNVERIIVMHNHPDNSPVSPEDIITTRRLCHYLSVVGVKLLENYVYTNDEIIGMVEMTKGDWFI